MEDSGPLNVAIFEAERRQQCACTLPIALCGIFVIGRTRCGTQLCCAGLSGPASKDPLHSATFHVMLHQVEMQNPGPDDTTWRVECLPRVPRRPGGCSILLLSVTMIALGLCRSGTTTRGSVTRIHLRGTPQGDSTRSTPTPISSGPWSRRGQWPGPAEPARCAASEVKCAWEGLGAGGGPKQVLLESVEGGAKIEDWEADRGALEETRQISRQTLKEPEGGIEGSPKRRGEFR